MTEHDRTGSIPIEDRKRELIAALEIVAAVAGNRAQSADVSSACHRLPQRRRRPRH